MSREHNHTHEYGSGGRASQLISSIRNHAHSTARAALRRSFPFTECGPTRYHASMLHAVEKIERTRLNAADWEQGALDLIAAQGVGAVAVEALARQLGVTKGSFYWHFPTREALLKAALERWEKDDTANVIDQVQPIADPRERLRELFRRTGREAKSHVIYSALLRALDHPNVQPVMARMSHMRMDFLRQAYRQIGMPADVAGYRARLAYAAYVGFLQLTLQVGMPRLEHDEMEAYVEHVIDALIPA